MVLITSRIGGGIPVSLFACSEDDFIRLVSRIIMLPDDTTSDKTTKTITMPTPKTVNASSKKEDSIIISDNIFYEKAKLDKFK